MRWAVLEQKSQPAAGLGGVIYKGQDRTGLAQQLIQRMSPIDDGRRFNVGEIRKERNMSRVSPASLHP